MLILTTDTDVKAGPLFYTPPQANATRLLGLGLVVALHAALIYALATGLAHRAIDIVRRPIMTTIIEEAPQPQAEPPPPAPRFLPPLPIFVPPPEVTIAKPPPVRPTAPTVITTVRPPPAAETPPAPVAAPAAAAPLRVAPRLDTGHSREPEYPPAARRLGEQGSLLLQALIDTDGRVLETKLVQSSGSQRLDRAALEGVKENYRFIPGTVDGKPEKVWFTIRFTWKLQ